MVDPEKQAAFISALRKRAEDAAAKNPALSEMRTVSKAVVDEMRTMFKQRQSTIPLGAYMDVQGNIEIVKPKTHDPSLGAAEILLKLRDEANKGRIRAAALCHAAVRQSGSETTVELIDVHMEHATGKAFRSVVPVDESIHLQGVPGVDGPAIYVSGGPTKPKVFQSGG